jgi:hypothetical protein
MATQYAFGQIVTNGLVLALDAADKNSYVSGSTTWNDLSGNNNSGSLVNGPTFNSANGGSIVFDGTNQYVTLGSTLTGTAAGTISFWIKLTNTITAGYAGNQRPWGKNADFECRWGGNGVAADNQKLSVDINGTLNLVSVQNTWLNTIWYNIAIVYNSGTNSSTLYVQNIQDATGTAGNPSALTGTFNIAATTSATGFVNGNIANFLIYNRALSATEVKQNYNAQKLRFGL